MNRPRFLRFEQPFWLVILVSGVATIFALVLALVGYAGNGQWQFLILAGMAALVLLVHGLAWWLGRVRADFLLAIWLVAAAQIIGAILVPLFVADYWVIGLCLLSIAPLEIGVVDRLRRIPQVFVLSLLGAAGMVAIDLIAPSGRPTIAADHPLLVFLILGLLMLYLFGMAVLLWQVRLRPGAVRYARIDLATQQALVFALISTLSIVLVTGVLVVQIRTSQVEQVGHGFQTLAEINAERAGNSLEQQINALVSLSRQETVRRDPGGLARVSWEMDLTDCDSPSAIASVKVQTTDRAPSAKDRRVRIRPDEGITGLVVRYQWLDNERTLQFRAGRMVGAEDPQGVRPAMVRWKSGWSKR